MSCLSAVIYIDIIIIMYVYVEKVLHIHVIQNI